MDDEDLELLMSIQSDEPRTGLEFECFPETPPDSPNPLRESKEPLIEENNLTTRMAGIKSQFPSRTSKVPGWHSEVAQEADLMREQPAQASTLGYCSDEDQPRAKKTISMAAFKDVVKESLEEIKQESTFNARSGSQDSLFKPRSRPVDTYSKNDVEIFSGLKIRDQLVPTSEITRKLSDLRFVRLQSIKMAMMCEKFSGSWATVGVLTDKGMPKLSSNGRNFVVWKLGTLDKFTVSVFLFGVAYTELWKTPPGTILALFNANVRPDTKSKEPSLSIFTGDQAMILGASADYRICAGKRKDGSPCTMVLNRTIQGQFCQYHSKATRQEFRTNRPELTGGKLALVGPGIRKGYANPVVPSPSKDENFGAPLKHITTSELKALLSDPEKLTKSRSQGKRFLEVMADRAPGIKETRRKGPKRQNSQENTKFGNISREDTKSDKAPREDAKSEKSSREDAKSGKRLPLAEKQLNVKNLRSNKVPANKTQLKPTGMVLDLDSDDDFFPATNWNGA